MPTVINLSKIKDRVYKLLESNPETRDDNNLLIAHIWNEELKSQDFNIKSKTAHDFFNAMCFNKVTAADSITRASRQLQKIHSHLRGKGYEKRYGKQTEIINQLKEY